MQSVDTVCHKWTLSACCKHLLLFKFQGAEGAAVSGCRPLPPQCVRIPVNWQPPSVHHQPRSVNRQLPSVNRQLPSVNQQPPSVNRQPPSVNPQPPSANRQPPSVNRQPPSANRPLPSIRRQSLSANNQPVPLHHRVQNPNLHSERAVFDKKRETTQLLKGCPAR